MAHVHPENLNPSRFTIQENADQIAQNRAPFKRNTGTDMGYALFSLNGFVLFISFNSVLGIGLYESIARCH